MRYKKIIIFVFPIALTFILYFFGLRQGRAAPTCPILFTSDVILDLKGLSATTYIASSSEASSLEINKPEGTLKVNGVCGGSFFLLKTADHEILRFSPTSTCSAGFEISSANLSEGYIKQWNVNTNCDVNFSVGVPLANTYYAVKLNQTPIPGSPFNSGPEAKVNFTYGGSGTYTIEIANAPSVETLSAINVTTTNATLRGKLIDLDGGDSATVWFEWGTSSNVYTSSSTPETVTSTGIFYKTISGLLPQTKYYFRAFAQNAAGTNYGKEESFVTIDKLLIVLKISDKTKIIEIDREGKITVQK